ncbi:MAG: GNAT family N-acetyltransferase [Anaerolineales bacterium]
MRLIPITAQDEDLTVRIECDPEMMRYIGGARPEEDVRATHKRRLKLMEKGEAHMFKAVAGNSNEVLGMIGIWKIDWKEPYAYEMGWMVLPEHQGKGVATEAALNILSQARSNPNIRTVYAFPAINNAASNAIARKIGMHNQGEFDNEGFAGILRCNDWRIDLD